jgi:hypothetical protein
MPKGREPPTFHQSDPVGPPRKSARFIPKQEKKQLAQAQEEAEYREAAVESLLFLSRLPPKIQIAFDDAKIAGKAEQLQQKYITGKSGPDMTSPMSIAVWSWGPVAVAMFLEERDAVRYMYSPTDNTGQCERAGLGNPKKSADIKCWLCGFTLINPATKTQYDSIACEHVLPVFQAVMYADIALAKRPSTSTDELISLEYGWSHKVCNGPKSNRLFIVESKDATGKFIGWKIDYDIIEKTLRETIKDIQSKGIDAGTLGTPKAQTDWIIARKNDIEVRLNKLLKFLNDPELGDARLIKLLSVGKLLDPERWASNVSIDQAAYQTYADSLIQNYDQYKSEIINDVLQHPDVLQYYPDVYAEISKYQWNQQKGRSRTKRKRRVTSRGKTNKRR